HDLRGTFVTLALAVGRTEAWVTDRTGHSSSAMIYRYKRAARLAAELDTGWFAPLDEAIPELAPRGGESADGTPGEPPSGGESEGESTAGAGVTDRDLPDRVSSQKTQCRRRDSNSHEGLPRRILNPLRLPFRHFGARHLCRKERALSAPFRPCKAGYGAGLVPASARARLSVTA